MRQRILVVDDEPRVLDALRRCLNNRYRLETAASAAAGLAALDEAVHGEDPYAVVVSDMMMPVMDGAQFLARAAVTSPDSVGIILSGQADMPSTVAAVNGGNLFRFLLKPCSPVELTAALDAGLRQYELVQSERQLLTGTLNGAVSMFSEALALVNPEAFRRARRLHGLVESVGSALGLGDDWELALAGRLGQIGCVTLPGVVVEKAAAGETLTDVEIEMYREHPQVARRLLEGIPRLERVARWIGDQAVTVDDVPAPEPDSPASQVFAAAAWLLVALDSGLRPVAAVGRLERMIGGRRALMDALLAASRVAAPTGIRREITAEQLRADMKLTADVLTKTGMILVREGDTVTETTVARLKNFARSVGVVEPLGVLVRPDRD